MIKMPARGNVLVRRPETEEHLPGGRIIIPEKARESYAANQFQVVSVGEPSECPYPDDCERQAHKFLTLKLCVHPIDPRIVEGAWVVIRPRSLVETGEPGLYVIRETDVLAVFSDAESESVIETSELRPLDLAG